jgi:hypothetical protein
MRAHRFPATRPASEASLAPIYAALLTLAAFGVVGWVVAVWPADSESAESRPESRAPAPASRSFEGGLRLPPEPSQPRSRMKSA